MNLKIDSSIGLLTYESCETFKNTYFVEHRRAAASAIEFDKKSSHPGQKVNTSINGPEKLGYQLQRR